MSGVMLRVKEIWHRFLQIFQGFKGDGAESSSWLKLILLAVAAYITLGFVLAVVWSFEPERFSVTDEALARVENDESRLVTGAYTTATLIHVVNELLDKRGGYLSNDISFPGVWMDNIPNWEYGVLIQARDMTKALREAFSRSQSQSIENNDLARAESQFNFNHRSWLLPKTESEYRDGVDFLTAYLHSLTDDTAKSTQFYARADNLRYWLSTVETRLGSLSQRLSASVGQRRLNTDLAGEPNAQQATQTAEELFNKTPWMEIDDVFFEARGSTWALIHFLKAIEKDFDTVLEKKNAKVSLQQIIRELEATQETVFSPMILNGGGFGLLANHSLVMASYISRANAGIIDLRELLAQG